MRNRPSRLPSPTLLVAVCALVVALGGTGYAVASLPRHSVGPAQLKKNAVTSKSVADGSLKALDFGAGQLPAGPAGAAGATGPRGTPGADGTAGPTGPTGPSNVYIKGTGGTSTTITAIFGTSNTAVRSMSLPAGSYYVRATGFADNSSTTVRADVRCNLVTSGTVVGAGVNSLFMPVMPNAGTNSYRYMFSLDDAVSLSSSGTVSVECNKSSAGQAAAVGVGFAAIKTASITSVL
jgi:hypothetical protein